ncbi:type I secretion system permease/ATPase [Salinarimonas soli]|uniref:Type I secretion system permease/ATPase n=1 Tax=Salinarimonas soli TaxID=1638099 RepID=A0A5B2V9G5_9HYPH|nr:type I secretion system permease/ATPase [Salinarimonas soli]KAA2234877.1 type I secretion system permease/ATPase [Salinarimonas soli]
MANAPPSARSEISQALRRCAGSLLGIGLFSAAVNLLMLTGSIFMLQVYDRVIPSRSIPTLVGLAILVAGLFAIQGGLDLIRTRMLARVGASLHERVAGRVFDTTLRLPLLRGDVDAGQPLRDLDQVRSFFGTGGPLAFFDLPWLPLYLTLCFLFHPLIGWTALGGAGILVMLTLLTEILSRRGAAQSVALASQRQAVADAARRNAEAVTAMGMGPAVAARWREADRGYVAGQSGLSDVTGGLGAISKMLRMALQSAVLGVGAYLVIQGEASGGIIIASSILSARALAPVELAIANWRGFLATRGAWRRLDALLGSLPAAAERQTLRPPGSTLTVQGVAVAPAGNPRLVVRDISFQLQGGAGLGIIGPSGSGKSCLVRALVGVWQPARGRVRLDGAALDQWSPETLGRHVGYLPQDVELFAGTIAQNIARFREGDDPDLVIQAAMLAGVHELILSLDQGYDTAIGDRGGALSAGQRQRVGLARALYGDPFLVVLDEPNSNLDNEGEAALTRALMNVRERGGIAVVVAHRPSALAALDHVLVIAGGEQKAFGPKDQVLGATVRTLQPVPNPAVEVERGQRAIAGGAS